MTLSAEQYESVMRDAKETVFVIAARRGIDTGRIDVHIDAGLGPGSHQIHVLVISVRGAPYSVSHRNIGHEWLAVGTGFINGRFAKLVTALLNELTAKVNEVGTKFEEELGSKRRRLETVRLAAGQPKTNHVLPGIRLVVIWSIT
jgi:hypothetical protein